MDWDKIRLFYEVVTAGNFTRAGEKLGVNQSSVSRQISTLEHELKVPLFHRHPRGLVLTEHGEVLFRSAQDIRLRLDETRHRLTETSERPAGDLRVTATVGIGANATRRELGPDVNFHSVGSGGCIGTTSPEFSWPASRRRRPRCRRCRRPRPAGATRTATPPDPRPRPA